MKIFRSLVVLVCLAVVIALIALCGGTDLSKLICRIMCLRIPLFTLKSTASQT